MKKRLLSALCALSMTAALIAAPAAETYTVTLTEEQAHSDVPVVLELPLELPTKYGSEPVVIKFDAEAKGAAVELDLKGDSKNTDVFFLDTNGCYVKQPDTFVFNNRLYIVIPSTDLHLVILEKLPFKDISAKGWAYSGISYSYYHKLMGGTGKDTFAPSKNIDRAQLTTILWREAGEPAPTKGHSFTDVSKDAYYGSAILWAEENGILTGKDGKLNPKGTVSREEMAVMLHRYCTVRGMDTSNGVDLSLFKDHASVSKDAQKAMSWAVFAGIFSGNNNQELLPQGTVSREQMATILMRLFAQLN